MVGMEMEWRTHADTWAVQCDMHRIMRCKVHEKKWRVTLKQLEPCRVRMSEMWHSQWEKCACARVRWGVLWTPPDAFRAPLSGREIQKKRQLQINNCDFSVVENLSKKIKTAVKLSGGWWQLLTCRLKSSWPVSWCLYRLHWERESMLPHCTIFSDHVPSCQVCWCHVCQLESMKTNSNMLSLVTSSKKRMMAVDVLLRNIQPN